MEQLLCTSLVTQSLIRALLFNVGLAVDVLAAKHQVIDIDAEDAVHNTTFPEFFISIRA